MSMIGNYQAPSIGRRDYLFTVRPSHHYHYAVPDRVAGEGLAQAACPGYKPGEVQTSWTQRGHLAIDVNENGRLLIADFGVDWRSVKDSTKREKLPQDWLRTFETDTSYRLRILGYSDCVGPERNNEFLRRGRAESVYQVLGRSARTRVAFKGAAPLGTYVADNNTVEGRAKNHGDVIEFSQQFDVPEGEEVQGRTYSRYAKASSYHDYVFLIREETAVSYLKIAEPQIARVAGVPAFLTGLSGLGQSSTVKLSNGHFGLVMSHISIPAAAIRLLLLSATFKQMAATLDGAYVDHRHWTKLSSSSNARLNNAFRVVGGGNLNGRRVLYVGFDPAGSRFIPGQSIESPTGWDIIRFSDALGQSDTIPWVRVIAHETAHAFARVTASGAAPKTPVDRVRAAVRDECNTRKVEHRVIAEIRNTTAGRKALAAHPVPPPVRTCDCERDWFPSQQKRSYLEHFVLGADWEAAARPLSDAERQKTLTDVAAIPLNFSAKTQPPTMPVAILRGTATVGSFAKQFPVLNSAAGQAAFVLRLVDASWRQLIAKVGEGSPTWTGGAHQLRLERHAQHLFKIPVSYTRC